MGCLEGLAMGLSKESGHRLSPQVGDGTLKEGARLLLHPLLLMLGLGRFMRKGLSELARLRIPDLTPLRWTHSLTTLQPLNFKQMILNLAKAQGEEFGSGDPRLLLRDQTGQQCLYPLRPLLPPLQQLFPLPQAHQASQRICDHLLQQQGRQLEA